MKTMMISDFKATCIATLKAVEESKETVVVTRRGKPIAEIDPIAVVPGRALGTQRGCMTIKGDVVRSDFADEWVMCKESK